MKKITINKIFIAIVILILIIIHSYNVFALTPGQLTGTETEIKELSFIDKITDFIKVIGTFLSVGVLMVLGIRYMMGSLEERASYKKSMMPYIVGCVILFGASYIVPAIIETTSDIGDSTDEVGNKILGLIQVIGTFTSIGALMVLGIKYMMGSAEQKASYKKSMIPYIVGAVLLFGAANITSMVYDTIQSSSASETTGSDSAIVSKGKEDGNKDAKLYLDTQTYSYSTLSYTDKTKIREKIQKEYNDAVEMNKYIKDRQSYDGGYYDAYISYLREWLNKN